MVTEKTLNVVDIVITQFPGQHTPAQPALGVRSVVAVVVKMYIALGILYESYSPITTRRYPPQSVAHQAGSFHRLPEVAGCDVTIGTILPDRYREEERHDVAGEQHVAARCHLPAKLLRCPILMTAAASLLAADVEYRGRRGTVVR